MIDHAQKIADGQQRLADTLALAAHVVAGGTPNTAALDAALRNGIRDLAAIRRRVAELVQEVQEISPADPFARTRLAFDLAQLDGLSTTETLVAVELLVPSYELASGMLRDIS